MKNNFIFMCLTIGMLSNGFYNDAFAANATEQTGENQQRQERVLTALDAKGLIDKMEVNKSTELIIPDGYTSIGKWVFEGCVRFTSVNIPNSVKSIEDGAFSKCERLTSVYIPNSVKSIGSMAFRGCAGLTSVNIPNSVKSIYGGAFRDCAGLTSVEIPGNVTFIGDNAFRDCAGLTSVNIPDSVTSIGNSAFAGCIKLTEVTIPNSVTSIGYYAFLECFNLEYVDIPDSVASIGDLAFNGCDNAKFTVPSQCMKDYLCVVHEIADNRIIVNEKLANPQNAWKWPEDGHVKIPQGVTNVDNYMFCYRKDIKSITIPDSVTSIGEFAFYGCNNLNKIYVYSDMVKQLIIDSKLVNPDIIEVIEKPENE